MKTVRALILVSLFLCATRFSNAQVPDSQIQLHREQLRIAVQAICPVTGV